MTLVTQRKKRSSTGQQRRFGQHHSQNKPYLKTYWPYLPLFVVAGIVVIYGGAKLFGASGAVIGSLSVVIAGASFLI